MMIVKRQTSRTTSHLRQRGLWAYGQGQMRCAGGGKMGTVPVEWVFWIVCGVSWLSFAVSVRVRQ